MGTLLISLKNHSTKSSIKGIGIMFPKIERIAASNQGILNSRMATGIDPLSSISGSIEIMSTISRGLRPLSVSQFTVLSANEDACKPDMAIIKSRVRQMVFVIL
jgi:hypothetical protein